MGRTLTSCVSICCTSVLVSACGNSGEMDTEMQTATGSSSSVAASPVTPTPAGSGDPVYDRYAAALAAEKISFRPGLEYGTYDTDKLICDNLRAGSSDPFYLAWSEKVGTEQENGRRVELMIPIVCPDQQTALEEALGPRPIMRNFPGGKAFVSWEVTQGQRVIQPGTWQTGTVSDCYWERLDSQGNIIENNMVSLSQSVVVTIAESDAAFNSQDCGAWTRTD